MVEGDGHCILASFDTTSDAAQCVAVKNSNLVMKL